ncbi:envelope stress response membrane protein PspB [Alterisphingorhabdus coralli]|uniref:Envelope stress response membrane protein PspB n=1 Tax=Alterisphingorhabdus coralli TaxID=3071408 RepID=A0AA97FAV6_9SPHN|nr:envelope stress response membrane protein PspB [Parasphingorhabdus sp. SCSIO 66989]WOE76477.1 envelope stress response membrane protein PspB [Parasphingorhabdus sp. SCSIO 66989]
MEDILVPIMVVGMLFIGLPWIIFHYITKWKTAATLTNEDEGLLDELHIMARRLDDRMDTVERIISADNPNWKPERLTGPDERLEDLTKGRDADSSVSRIEQILEERARK